MPTYPEKYAEFVPLSPTESLADEGLVVPTPTLPLLNTKKSSPTAKSPSLVVALPTPRPPEKYPSPVTASVASGCVVVPPPKMFE